MHTSRAIVQSVPWIQLLPKDGRIAGVFDGIGTGIKFFLPHARIYSPTKQMIIMIIDM